MQRGDYLLAVGDESMKTRSHISVAQYIREYPLPARCTPAPLSSSRMFGREDLRCLTPACLFMLCR